MKKNTFRQLLPLMLGLAMSLGLTNCRSSAPQVGDRNQPIRLLMVGGGDSHDFNRWYKQADAQTLRQDGFSTVRYTDHTDSIGYYLANADVLYLANNQPIRDPAVRKAIFDFVGAGKGVVLGHAGMWYNWRDWPEYNQQLVSGGSRGHNRYGAFEVTITDPNHPITQGVPTNFSLQDELYYFKPDPAGPGVEVLATASAAGSDTTFPSVFVVKQPTGRVAGIALGHDAGSHDLPAYQTLLRNAVRWAAGK